MDVWFIEANLFVLGFMAIMAIGVLLVAWGQRGDRSKGRARCPKCWYDMRGTLPKLECPECGHDAEQEEQLYQARERRGIVVIGKALVWSAMLLWLLLVVCWNL